MKPIKEWIHKSSAETNTWLLTLKSKDSKLRTISGIWKSTKLMPVSTVSIRPKLNMKLRSKKKSASNVRKTSVNGTLTTMKPETTMRSSKGTSMKGGTIFTTQRTNSNGCQDQKKRSKKERLKNSEEKCRNSKWRLINTDKLGRDSNKRPKISNVTKKEDKKKKLRDSRKTTIEPSKITKMPE